MEINANQSSKRMIFCKGLKIMQIDDRHKAFYIIIFVNEKLMAAS
jgi:hypothetical protein